MSKTDESRTIDWTRAKPVWEATPSVVAAWVFGSAQDGRLRARSEYIARKNAAGQGSNEQRSRQK